MTSEEIATMVRELTRSGVTTSPRALSYEYCDKIKGSAYRVTKAKNSNERRISINSTELYKKRVWLALIKWAVKPTGPVARVMNAMFGDAWWIEICGGEIICGKARFDPHQCGSHSDWKGVVKGVIALSLMVHKHMTQGRAPLTVFDE